MGKEWLACGLITAIRIKEGGKSNFRLRIEERRGEVRRKGSKRNKDIDVSNPVVP